VVTQISNKLDIPRPVIAVVSEILADNFTHSRINILFSSAGAPGDAPDGNKVDKCHNWLLRCNRKPGVNALAVLGVLLEALLEVEQQTPCWKDQTDRIYAILRRHNLEYQRGGRILLLGAPTATKDLHERLRANGYATIEDEMRRGTKDLESDPYAAVTAACSLLESVCKVILEDENIELPANQSLKHLWTSLSKALQLGPGSVADEDVRRILSGMFSAVDGIASFRTHVGSAHGRGRVKYVISARHARLAVNAAQTLALFALETHEHRRASRQ